jgi:type I restriction enzyme, R subunit
VKAALTELFNEVKTDKTPIIVERVVNDIDGEIVKAIRFPEWKQSISKE